jgi:hypothetical protein
MGGYVQGVTVTVTVTMTVTVIVAVIVTVTPAPSGLSAKASRIIVAPHALEAVFPLRRVALSLIYSLHV